MAEIITVRCEDYDKIDGFIQGVEFVNDSSIKVLELPVYKNGEWVAIFVDEDEVDGTQEIDI